MRGTPESQRQNRTELQDTWWASGESENWLAWDKRPQPTSEIVGRNKLNDENDRLMPVAWAVPPREVTREKHGAPADFHHTNGSERCLPGPALPLTPACPAVPSSWTPTSDALRGSLSPDTRSLHLSLLPLHGLIRSEFSSLANLFLSSSSN